MPISEEQIKKHLPLIVGLGGGAVALFMIASGGGKKSDAWGGAPWDASPNLPNGGPAFPDPGVPSYPPAPQQPPDPVAPVVPPKPGPIGPPSIAPGVPDTGRFYANPPFIPLPPGWHKTPPGIPQPAATPGTYIAPGHRLGEILPIPHYADPSHGGDPAPWIYTGGTLPPGVGGPGTSNDGRPWWHGQPRPGPNPGPHPNPNPGPTWRPGPYRAFHWRQYTDDPRATVYHSRGFRRTDYYRPYGVGGPGAHTDMRRDGILRVLRARQTMAIW